MNLLSEYLQLSLASISVVLIKRILNQYSNLKDFFKDDPLNWIKLGLKKSQVERILDVNNETIKKTIHWSFDPNHHIVSIFDQAYPKLLKQIHGPPLLLYVVGDPKCLDDSCIAVVGARRPSKEGLYNARLFSQYLSQNGLTIVSGMAIGIDGEAHQTALSANKKTIAVLGSGFNHIYPKAHQKLYENIANYGAVISEFPLHTPPMPKNFPKRNRIISGLSLGALMIQAKQKSGSLITAHLSMEQGRHVWAIPGSIHQSLSKGAHYLIQEGATLVEHPQQIMNDLINNQLIKKIKKTPEIITDNERKINPIKQDDHPILKYINDMPLDIDDLVLQSNLPLDQILSSLSVLEILGMIEKIEGGYILQLTK